MRAGALRIALLAGTLRVGGAEKQLTYMAEALSRAGARVEVFSLGGPDEPFARHLRASGITVWSIARGRSRLVRMARVVAALRRFAPDIIQATHFYAGFYAIAAGRLLRRPVLGAVRNDLFREVVENGAISRWLYGMPTLLIANSHAAMENARRLGFDPSRLRLVPNVIALDGATPAARQHAHDGAVTVIAVANLHRAKRLDRFIDALARARQSSPRLRGVIAGSGVLEHELKAQTAARGLDETALRFAGHSDDVNGLLGQADFLCLTSSAEGTPNAVLEAMAAGLPVIGTAVGDIPRLVDEGVTGFVVEEDDIEAIAARMSELAGSASLRASMGARARARVERDFSTGALAERLCALYRDVARRADSDRLLRKIDAFQQGADIHVR